MRIARALCAIQEPDEVMRVTVEAAIYLTEADCGQLFLLDPRQNSWSFAPCVARPIHELCACGRWAPTGSRPRWPKAAGPRSPNGAAADEKRSTTGGADTHCEKGGRRPGRRRQANHSFDENDRYQLGILAGFAGVALANTQLLEI